MSVGIIIAAIALVLCILAIHVWAFWRQPRPRRIYYLLVLTVLIVGTLFIPIGDGAGHVATIRFWILYKILAFPEFYRASNRDFFNDNAVIGFPLLQHFICVLLASLAVGRRRNIDPSH